MDELMLTGAQAGKSEVCSKAVVAFMQASARYLGVTQGDAVPLSTDSQCLLAAPSVAAESREYSDHLALLPQKERRS